MALPLQDLEATEQVAWLARVDVAELQRIQTPREWSTGRTRFNCCNECLFLNRFEVTSPGWLLDWLNPAGSTCPAHQTPCLTVAASALRRCSNMDGVLRRLSPTRRRQGLWGCYDG